MYSGKLAEACTVFALSPWLLLSSACTGQLEVDTDSRSTESVDHDDQLYQNWWNGSTWVWVSHGVSCTSSPTASNVFGTQRVFMRSSTGSVGERYWTGSQWLSLDHGPSVLLP